MYFMNIKAQITVYVPVGAAVGCAAHQNHPGAGNQLGEPR